MPPFTRWIRSRDKQGEPSRWKGGKSRKSKKTAIGPEQIVEQGSDTEIGIGPGLCTEETQTAGIGLNTEDPPGRGPFKEDASAPVRISDFAPNTGHDSTLDVSRYTALVEQTRLVVFLHDFSGNFLDANDRTLHLLGYTRADIPSLTLSSLLPEPEKPAVLKALHGLLQTGIQENPILYPLKKKHGGFIWIEGESTLVFRNGHPCAVQAIGLDATERKSAEETLRRSEEKYRILVESAHEGILVVQDGILKFSNARAAELIGISTDESSSVPFDSLLPPDDHGLAFERYQEGLLKKDIPHVYAFRIRDETGSTRWIEISAIQFSWEGRPATLNFLSDITWRKRAEEALHASEEKYRHVVENAHDAIFILQDGKIRFHNPNTEELLGLAPMEADASSFEECVVPEDREEVLAWLQGRVRRGASDFVHAFRVRKKGGEASWVEASTVPVSWEDEPALLCFVRDVSEQRELQFQLQQSQKMEAIGRLTGGIAHDFNNMMTVVIGYSEFLMKGLKENEQAVKGLEGIRKAGEHAAGLTRQLLAFSRKQVLRPQVLDLNAAIRGTDSMLRRVLNEDVELRTALDPGIGRIKADPNQILQILMNFAVNARDAMPKGGKLTIETKNVELDEVYTKRHMDVKAGSYVMLAVSDTGVGMDEETRSHIFEPFFTTKAQGKGTGLGLATVYGIVKQSGGHIWVYSESGKGTAFKVYLPIVQGDVRAVSERGKVSVLPDGSETVLLVEDEEGLRGLIRDVLTGMHYRVLVASGPEEALAISRQHRGPVHLLLTDVVMPGMSGPDLAKRLCLRHTGMRVLYMSGYTNNTITLHGVPESGMFFLEKPFTPEVLLRKVREVLDESRGQGEAKTAACS